MVKTRVTDYTTALEELLQGKSKSERAEVFALFLQLLWQRGELTQVNSILSLLQQRLLEREETLPVVLTGKEQVLAAKETLTPVKQFLQARFPGKKFVYQENFNSNCNGVILEIAGSQFDFSLQKQIKEFRNELIKT